MAPKPAPKLTKKQLQELKKEEERKREEEEKQRKEEQEARKKEQMRLEEIDRQKRAEEERIRILKQKQEYRDWIESRIKEEKKSLLILEQQNEWQQLITEFNKSYNSSQPKLSTFINVLKQESYQTPQKVLKECEQAQTYIRYIREMLLRCRAEDNTQDEEYYKEAIIKIREIEMEKIEKIMIQMANSAEDMEEKNNEMSKKGQPNKRLEGQKILEYQHFLSPSIKIGMFLNSSTTKNLNKFRPIEIKEFGLNSQIPSKWMNANSIVKFQWVNFNHFSPNNFERFKIIGGVYNLEFYQLLLGSKKINNIVVKKFFKDKEILEKHKLPTAIIKEPFNVAYKIPDYVFLHTHDQSSLRLAQYDISTEKWNTIPADSVVEYDPKQKRVICKIYRPEPIAYIQDRCFDFPYVGWQLRSVEHGKAHFDIELKRKHLRDEESEQQPTHFILKFIIEGANVQLQTYEQYHELKDLCEEWWTPELMLHELSERGFVLLPLHNDYEQAGVPVKDFEAEKNAIRDIAYAVESFYIRSEINDSEQIVVKIRENPDYESVFLEDQEKDWKKIQWSGSDRCEVTNRNILERHLNLEVNSFLYRFYYHSTVFVIKSVLKE